MCISEPRQEWMPCIWKAQHAQKELSVVGKLQAPSHPGGLLRTTRQEALKSNVHNFNDSARDGAVSHRRNPALEDTQQASAITILLLRAPSSALHPTAAYSDRPLSRGEETAVTGGRPRGTWPSSHRRARLWVHAWTPAGEPGSGTKGEAEPGSPAPALSDRAE